VQNAKLHTGIGRRNGLVGKITKQKGMFLMVSSYAEKLKDPRWQRKRLEIMDRDGWFCQYCSNENNTLNVHHKIYIPNKEPWDYPNDYLITLCDICHKKEKDDRDEAENTLLRILRGKFELHELQELISGFKELVFPDTDKYIFVMAIKNAITVPTMQNLLLNELDLFFEEWFIDTTLRGARKRVKVGEKGVCSATKIHTS
jgi:hypothetical protein